MERIESYIEVNGIKEEIYMNFTEDGEVKLLDVDENDDFIEIAIFDEGPSADPQYHIYRYDGNKLYYIGSIDDRDLVNGKGKILPRLYVSDFLPVFYSAWLEIEDNDFVLKENDTEEYLGKDYILNRRYDVFFVPMEEIDEDFSPSWDRAKIFETSKLKLVDIWYPYEGDNILNFYFVELANGEKGLMYFWIGD